MLSIDQNCHSLWDVAPKLQALARSGRAVTHYIEDVDAAFTALGTDVGGLPLRLARERFHHSGGADWGAALFYTEFLGRTPAEVRSWEPMTGLKTGVLAKQIGRDVEDLYEEFSPGDNWQLIGPSFVGDREHHRVIGDLTVSETADFLRELMAKARTDMFRAFPAADSQQRLTEWFAGQEALLGRLLERFAGAALTDLYDAWMRTLLPDRVALDLSSRLFSCGGAGPVGRELLDLFVAEYDAATLLYNEAVAETDTHLRPLRRKDGELPLFATFVHEGRLVRTGVRLRDGKLCIDGREFAPTPDGRIPVRQLAEAGVRCLAGKAAVLVSQVRIGDRGRRLALPYRGSFYMPTAHLLARKLHDAGLLPGPLRPVVRVRLRLLDRMGSLDTPIRLPAHLAAAMGAEEVPARRLAECHADLAAEARRRLDAFGDEVFRERWQREHFPKVAAEIDALDARRRPLASTDPKAPELREIWKRMRALRTYLLRGLLGQIDRDSQLADLDYYDSRGAVLPWCIALGGRPFYDHVIAQTEVHEEDSLQFGG